MAETSQVLTAVSPPNRVALFELFTSEGCSSCPQADRFMSSLKEAGISDRQLIPLAFHVTYWDKLGWKDRFADKQHDDRQRRQVMLNASHTVYTPQYMLNGKDFRNYKSMYFDIDQINAQPAPYRLELSAVRDSNSITVALDITSVQASGHTAIAYIALYEHNLDSVVTDGENDGERLQHDYVVRELKGPFVVSQDQSEFKEVFTTADYKIADSGVVAFVQQSRSAVILQAVRLELKQ